MTNDSQACHRRLRAALLVLGVLVVAATFLVVHASGPHRQPDEACPVDTTVDPVRTRQLLALLHEFDETRAVLASQSEDPHVCYGPVAEGVLVNGARFLLPRQHSNRVNAARLVHLLLHQRDSLALDDATIGTSQVPCDELIDRIMAGEQRAHQLESRLRRAWGLDSIDYNAGPLEAAYHLRCQNLREGSSAARNHFR